MFRRHCVLYNYLLENPQVNWALVIDGDMGVINPNHQIEEYLQEDTDLIFYNRLFLYEIMAGSFIVRNTKFTQKFIKHWFEYEVRHPQSWHGTDNGAIQMVFLDLMCKDCSPMSTEVCNIMWKESK